MAYIAHTYIKEKNKLKKELNNIYGIGFGKAKVLTRWFNSNTYSKLTKLSKRHLKKLVRKFKTGPFLEKHNKYSLDLLKNIKCYKGQRHLLHLPLRGQRTCTNNKTQRRLSVKRFN